jgi:hypothetical protein
MLIHDNERNARKTAELMHENCAYNFVSVRHDTGKRCIKLPSHTVAGSFDPNEFFDPDIVKQCIDDEAACKDHLKNKLNSKNVAEIDRFVQISYFMSVKECSESFSLPVIALHNNAVNDTQAYRDQKAGKKVEELKKDDIEKGPLTGDEKKDEAADKLKLKPLSDMLLSKFGAEVKNKLTEGGKTNIIRWCFSGELSACHIGDPDRPDHVTWATNREDFDKLKAKNINVALQNDPARLKPESMTDLSTLFLSLKTLMGTKLGPEVAKVTADLATLAADHKFRISELAALTTSGGASSELGALRALVIQGMIAFLAHEMTHKQAELDAVQKEFDKYANLHFLNIEGPGYSLGERTDAGRVESYEIIVENLKALNLHCCDGKEAEAEAKVKAGLTLTPPPKAKSKP